MIKTGSKHTFISGILGGGGGLYSLTHVHQTPHGFIVHLLHYSSDIVLTLLCAVFPELSVAKICLFLSGFLYILLSYMW